MACHAGNKADSKELGTSVEYSSRPLACCEPASLQHQDVVRQAVLGLVDCVCLVLTVMSCSNLQLQCNLTLPGYSAVGATQLQDNWHLLRHVVSCMSIKHCRHMLQPVACASPNFRRFACCHVQRCASATVTPSCICCIQQIRVPV